jgi:hypothetical protein
MQTLYKDEAVTIAPNLDGYLLSDFQYTLGDLSDGFWLKRCATLYRYVDVRDREFFSPHHGSSHTLPHIQFIWWLRTGGRGVEAFYFLSPSKTYPYSTSFARVSSEPDAASFAKRAMPFDNSSLQWSPQGSGLSDDVEETFDRLYERYVTHYDNRARLPEKAVALQPVEVEPSYFQGVANPLQVLLAGAASTTELQFGFTRAAAKLWTQYARYQANSQLAEGTNELAQTGAMVLVSGLDLARRQAVSLSIPGQQSQGQTT